MSRIAFFKPDNIAAAAEILAKDNGFQPIAGGTDLLVKFKSGMQKNLSGFVDLNALSLNQITAKSDGSISIGACCTMSKIASDPLIKTRFPALASAVSAVGAPQIRSMATIGGNVANASPAGDSIPALLSLDAVVVLAGKRKSHRRINISDFFLGPGKTVLKKGEIIESFEITDRQTFGIFHKLGARAAHAISKINIAVSTWLTADAHREIRVALGAVAPTVVRCLEVEGMLQSSIWPIPEDVMNDAAARISSFVNPIDDLRSTKKYRKKMAGILFKRAIESLR